MPLTRGQRRTLRAFADTILPAGGPVPLSAGDAATVRKVAENVQRMPRRFRALTSMALTAWELSPLVSHGRTFTGLPSRLRLRWVQRALKGRSGPLGLLAFWLRMLCVSAYVSDRRVEAAVGFTHSCIDESPPPAGPGLQPLAYPDVRGEVTERADAVIIGSGAGGAVVAKELAEAGLRVIVIEEGAYFQRSDYADGAPWERVQKLYRDAGLTTAFGRPAVPIPLGKAVGGTTVVNSGTCFRTPEKVLREWESQWGIEGIDANFMEPLFRRVEETISVQPVPWEIIGKNAEVFDRGVKAAGYHGAPIDRNISGCRGCGECAFGCPSDAKQAMHLSYLPRAAARGAVIYARCRAHKIVVEGGRATGVDADILDASSDDVRGRLRVSAPVVVLAAGAVHTPALLMANRLGLESGQVGRNLRVHPALGVSALFEEEVYGWRGTLQSYYVDDLRESEGVLLEVTSPLPSGAAVSMSEVGRELKDALAALKHRASVGLFVSDSSAGRVVRGVGPRWWSSPTMFYSLNQQDTDRLQKGIALAARIFLAAGAPMVFSGIPRVRPIRSEEDVRAFEKLKLRAGSLTPVGFHPMGTCRIGRDPSATVANPWGEVHGVPNLYIADASIFPSCLGVNPQVSIMAFATRTASRILERGG